MNTEELLPSFAGIATFLRAPMASIKDVKEGMVAVAGAPHDSTNCARPGTRFGPRAIREGSTHLVYHFKSAPGQRLIDVQTGRNVRLTLDETLVDLGDFPVYPADVQRTSQSLREHLAEVVRRGAFPVVMGGDHYVTYPLVQGFIDGLKDRQPVKKIGYIQYDAHLDLDNDDLVFGRYYHGSNARRAAELPEVSVKNMVWVGASGYRFAPSEEYEFVKEGGATIIMMDEVRRDGIEAVTRKALDIASDGCDAVYLTLDIDVVDNSQAPGTGSINFGGISSSDLLKAVDILKNSDLIKGLDLVEVAPNWDPTGATPRLAAVAIMDFISPRIFEYE